MAKWAVQDKADFEARQACFDFGDACRFVAALTLDVKKALTGFVQRLFKQPATVQKAHQLVLELDDIAKMPLPLHLA